MPGKKDFVLVRKNGCKKHVQKRLILCNLRELYRYFKGKNPDIKIGFSKFTDLRPLHCVLPVTTGTHSVCICTIHHNVKFMIDYIKMTGLTAEDSLPIKTYHDCIARIICYVTLHCLLATWTHIARAPGYSKCKINF